MKASDLKPEGIAPDWSNFITQGRFGGVTAHETKPVITKGFCGENWTSTGKSTLLGPIDIDEFEGKTWKRCLCKI